MIAYFKNLSIFGIKTSTKMLEKIPSLSYLQVNVRRNHSIDIITTKHAVIITPKNNFPDLYFAAFANNDRYVDYMIHPNGKINRYEIKEKSIYSNDINSSAKSILNLIKNINKNNLSINDEADTDIFGLLHLEPPLLNHDISKVIMLISSLLDYRHPIYGVTIRDLTLYNSIVEVSESVKAHVLEIFSRYPLILVWILMLNRENQQCFFRQIDQYSTLDTLLDQLLKLGICASTLFIKKFAFIRPIQNEINYEALKEFIYKTVQNLSNPTLYARQQELIQGYMLSYAKEPEEVIYMAKVFYLFSRLLPNASGLARLNFMMHKNKTWKEEYLKYCYLETNAFTHDYIGDMLRDFTKHVLLPQLVKNSCSADHIWYSTISLLNDLTLEFLSRRSFNTILNLARWWQYHKEQFNYKINSNRTSPPHSWPALSQIQNAPNGYKIVCLHTREDLEKEGKIMNNCVGRSYVASCSLGDYHILSIRDCKNQSLSNVGLEICDNRVEVNQHQGYANSGPSIEAKNALKWYLSEIHSGKIKIDFYNLARFKYSAKKLLSFPANYIGFDPEDEVCCQTAFDFYHKEFIRSKEITNAEQFMTKYGFYEKLIPTHPVLAKKLSKDSDSDVGVITRRTIV